VSIGETAEKPEMPLGCVREGEGGKQHRRGVPQSGGRAL